MRQNEECTRVVKSRQHSLAGERQYRNPLLDRVKLEKPIPPVIPSIPTPKCKIYNHGFAFYSTFVFATSVIMNEEASEAAAEDENRTARYNAN